MTNTFEENFEEIVIPNCEWQLKNQNFEFRFKVSGLMNIRHKDNSEKHIVQFFNIEKPSLELTKEINDWLSDMSKVTPQFRKGSVWVQKTYSNYILFSEVTERNGITSVGYYDFIDLDDQKVDSKKQFMTLSYWEKTMTLINIIDVEKVLFIVNGIMKLEIEKIRSELIRLKKGLNNLSNKEIDCQLNDINDKVNKFEFKFWELKESQI